MDKYFQPAMFLLGIISGIILTYHNRHGRWPFTKRKGPTEVICYPEKWSIIVYSRDSEIWRVNSTHPAIKKKFKEMLKWFDSTQTGCFHLEYDGGEMIFDREHIAMIEFEVTASTAKDF